jgi:hypothetical protein
LEGAIAPVTKTVSYGTVDNISGEPTKCWITSNLGADHQATTYNDDTEASAGWYWQFNRKQGYKLADDGFTRTPNTTWITNIYEDLDWQITEDPCSTELGIGWRIPTYTEWSNVIAGGSWTDWFGPWNSDLKIHAAGYLSASSGSLSIRGSGGWYWSSNQVDSNYGWDFSSNAGSLGSDGKIFGISVRCIKD